MTALPLLVFKATTPDADAKADDARIAAAEDDPAPPPSAVFKHGDRVKFVFRCPIEDVEVHGEGVIVSSARHSVALVRTDDGREIKVPFRALRPLAKDRAEAAPVLRRVACSTSTNSAFTSHRPRRCPRQPRAAPPGRSGLAPEAIKKGYGEHDPVPRSPYEGAP
jgi:hypothetical protein